MRHLVAAALASGCALLPAGLAAEPTISFVWMSTTGTGTTGSETIDADVGDVLALHAFVAPDVGLTFAGFSLAFDPAVLQANAAVECPDPASTPPGSNLIPGTCNDSSFSLLTPVVPGVAIDNVSGEVLGADALGSSPPGPSGPIEILAVELEVVGSPGPGTDVEVFYVPRLDSVNDDLGVVAFPTAIATLLPEPGVGAGLAAGALGLLVLRRRRRGTSLGAAAALALVLLVVSGAAGAQDADGDGVPDASDNCLLEPNAPPLDCDADQDGYGNACDTDYDQDGAASGADDFPTFVGAFGLPGPHIADHNCDGLVGGPDYGEFIENWHATPVGPSGLACAGTVPCP